MTQPMPSYVSIIDRSSNNLHLRSYVGLFYSVSFASGLRTQLKLTRVRFKSKKSLRKLHLNFPKRLNKTAEVLKSLLRLVTVI